MKGKAGGTFQGRRRFLAAAAAPDTARRVQSSFAEDSAWWADALGAVTERWSIRMSRTRA